MAEMATYVGVFNRTAIANLAGGNIARGLRITKQADGTFIVTATNATRGDMISLGLIEAGKPGPAVSCAGGGKVAVVAAVAVNMGDLAYSAASGQFTNVATGAQLMGRFTQPASGAGVLTEVELLDVA